MNQSAGMEKLKKIMSLFKLQKKKTKTYQAISLAKLPILFKFLNLNQTRNYKNLIKTVSTIMKLSYFFCSTRKWETLHYSL